MQIATCLSGLLLIGLVVARGDGAARAQGVAWDGRGAEPGLAAEKPAGPPKAVRTGAARIRHLSEQNELSGLKPYSEEWWARKKELDDADSERLKRRMSICRAC